MYKLLIILIFFSSLAFGSEYKEGDVLYVWVRNGVNLRETPSPTGKVIEVLKYGRKVEVLSQNEKVKFDYEYLQPLKKYDGEKEIKPLTLHGYWIKIKVGDKVGYTLNKLLLEYEPYNAYNFSDESDYFSIYLQKVFKLEKITLTVMEYDEYDKEEYGIDKHYSMVYSSDYSKNKYEKDTLDYSLTIENIDYEDAVVFASVIRRPMDYIDYFCNEEGKSFTYSIEGHPKNRLTVEKLGKGAKISWYYCRWD
ncbi:MAG: SH3 domain-containing protein [Fusobacteriaceae bacterium]|nr:SH3 domain-containing protein [Fusobacteriaceae bacterium]MBN2838687.1 SH3 domain-containing protein [Fusobacteriaceae bacterium]